MSRIRLIFAAAATLTAILLGPASAAAAGSLLPAGQEAPGFELCINGKVWSSSDPVWKSDGVAAETLSDGKTVYTRRFRGRKALSGLILEVDREQMDYIGGNILIRERLRLRSKVPGKFRLNNVNGKQRLVFPIYSLPCRAGEVTVTDLSMAHFEGKANPLTRHANHPDTVSYKLGKGDAPLALKGPVMIVRTPDYKVVKTYEHASQDGTYMIPGKDARADDGNDSYQDICGKLDKMTDDDFWFIENDVSLNSDGLTVANSVRRGGYIDGEEIPSDGWYETVWSGFMLLDSGSDPYDAVRDYIFRMVSGNPLSRRAHFYYNTWGMQRDMPEDSLYLVMNEKRLLREIDRAAEMGLDCFVFDDGWETMFGDWRVNTERLPNGLAPLVERLRSHGMTPGIWISLAGVNWDMPLVREHPEWLVRDTAGEPITGQWGKPVFDIVGPYYDVLLAEMKALIDQGIRYFKWDAFNTFSSDCPGLWHGDSAIGKREVSRKERIDRYNYLAPIYVVRLMRELREYCPDVVIENDLTEHERCMIGLLPLQEGKLYFINNGASRYRDYTSLRTRSLRGVINEYSFFMPQELFTYAMFPQDNDGCSLYNAISALSAGHGFWGNLDMTTPEQRAAIRDLVMKAKRVMPHIEGRPTRRVGKVDDSPEIYSQCDYESGYGLVTAFSREDITHELTLTFREGSVREVLGQPYTISGGEVKIFFNLKGPDGCAAAFIIGSDAPDGNIYSAAEFEAPGMKWRPIPLWFWNNTEITAEELEDQLERMVTADGYGGCSILPFGTGFRPRYLSEEYFTLYGRAIGKVASLGARMSVYDEYGFPSGSMGAINGSGETTFMNNHPGHTVKRLDKTEYPVAGGAKVSLNLDLKGRLMSVVAVNMETGETISLRNCLKEGNRLEWQAPKGDGWRVMLFECVTDGDPNVDYLSAESVKLFVHDTHEEYFRRFPEAFGTVVESTFFDEPTMYRAGGRMWTDDFNEKFESKYGFAPDELYPALWYDIGENTVRARCLLFGLHSALYSEGFMKTISEWASAHGILATGHQDQEEVRNPTLVSGDLMLSMKHSSMPGIDKISETRPTESYYKVVSSAANCWDKPLVMSETYGAMGNIPVSMMYNIAIGQYTKGINHLIPHAVWYNDSNVTFLPELSWRNPLYNKDLPQFNRFLARLNYILARSGRHVADVAMLYPIMSQYAGTTFDGPKGWYEGGVDVPDTDYPEISRLLTDELGIDFTYIHPEVLDDRCRVQDGRLLMDNTVNFEQFRVIVLPGVKVISKANMSRIEEAWKSGVGVIFTTCLPEKCADGDGDVAGTVARMLEGGPDCRSAIFLQSPDAASLRKAMDRLGGADDVTFSGGEPFNYIHKVIEGRDVYYFGNIDKAASECAVRLRNAPRRAVLMDPHTGEVRPAEFNADGSLTLRLAPDRSVFLLDASLAD